MTFCEVTVCKCHYVESCNAWLYVLCSVVKLSVITLNAVMLSAIMLSVTLLNVIILTVVAPKGPSVGVEKYAASLMAKIPV